MHLPVNRTRQHHKAGATVTLSTRRNVLAHMNHLPRADKDPAPLDHAIRKNNRADKNLILHMASPSTHARGNAVEARSKEP
jgi:hypothetical protein